MKEEAGSDINDFSEEDVSELDSYIPSTVRTLHGDLLVNEGAPELVAI